MEEIDKILNAVRVHFDELEDEDDFYDAKEELLCFADEIGLDLDELQ